MTLQLLCLAVLGAAIGALINWAIYQWAVYQHRPISPWMRPRPELVADPADKEKLLTLSPRGLLDFIPIFGWFRLRRDTEILGKGSWIRPLLIEIAWMVGLPLYYCWHQSGGLIAMAPNKLTPVDANAFPALATTWFWVHASLIALMFIATFIDFDEQMIPDQVTVPGTIIALLVAAVLPLSCLPLTVATPGLPGLEPVDYSSGSLTPVGTWHLSTSALATCIAIFVIWIWGLLPKCIPRLEFRLGLIGSLKLMLASITRPTRKNRCEIRVKNRKMFLETKLFLGLLVIGVTLIIAGWPSLSNAQKLNVVSSFIGMGVAGGMIWGIRIVGGYALGQMAMGFGDVTLMCMIGAVLGWQASLAGFVYSIMFAVVFAIVLFIVTKESYLAFGPYLCMGALTAMITWPETWQRFASPVFQMGPLLLIVLGGSLLLMAVLLPIVRWLKESLLGG